MASDACGVLLVEPYRSAIEAVMMARTYHAGGARGCPLSEVSRRLEYVPRWRDR